MRGRDNDIESRILFEKREYRANDGSIGTGKVCYHIDMSYEKCVSIPNL